MSDTRPLKVHLDPGIDAYKPEVVYVLRTLVRLAGFASEITRADGAGVADPPDLFYGPIADAPRGRVHLVAHGHPFEHAQRLNPVELAGDEALPLLRFDAGPAEVRRIGSDIVVRGDPVFSCWWMLTGAGESGARLDRRDNLDLTDSFIVTSGLLRRPLVSLWAAFLREHFRELGIRPEPLPWTESAPAAFAFTHDVDYPEILRGIETVRVLAGRERRHLLAEVWRGQPFWKFGEWLDLARRFDTRPAYYFMARRGSLPQYALGTPDAFYDIRNARFRSLFRGLREEGCEIGLHASYHAHRDEARIAREKAILEDASGGPVTGNRHHYWHLDPSDPAETLRRHEAAGITYDSSLAFEFYPGYRRGVCHPFHPWHAAQRRELSLLELPPAWMDDHFDRRLAKNGIREPEAEALALVEAGRRTGGVVVVDYHVRGMNAPFFPRWGPWLADFADRNLHDLACRTPAAIADAYARYEAMLDARSAVRLEQRSSPVTVVPPVTTARDPVTVVPLTESLEAAWDAYVRAHRDATPYHLIAWRDVTRDGLRHEPVYLCAQRPDGSLAGVLPLFEVDGLFGRRLVSVPMRDRGGPLADDAAVAGALIDAAVDLTGRRSGKYLEVRSRDPLPGDLVRERRLVPTVAWLTTRLDLTPGSDALWKALTKRVRAPIRQAPDRGIRVRQEDGAAAMEVFYRLFARTRQSMGIPPFPRALFEAVHTHMIRRDLANLFMVYHGDTPINGLINVYLGDTVLPAYTAPQPEWRGVSPGDVVLWHAIDWAAKRGFRTWDFGADSPRQHSLLWYKRKWGGVHQPVWYYYHLEGAGQPPEFDSSSPAYTLARRAWKLLPAPVGRAVGAWVTRQLS